MNFEKLLEPGRIGTLELKNRFVMPPMGSNFGSSDGFVTDEMCEYYRRRAAGGLALFAFLEYRVIRRYKKNK